MSKRAGLLVGPDPKIERGGVRFAVDPMQGFPEADIATDRADDIPGWIELASSFPSNTAAAPELETGILDTVESFSAAVARLRSLCWMPDEVWAQARRYERLRAIAFLEEFGRPYELPPDLDAGISNAFSKTKKW